MNPLQRSGSAPFDPLHSTINSRASSPVAAHNTLAFATLDDARTHVAQQRFCDRVKLFLYPEKLSLAGQQLDANSTALLKTALE